MERPDIGNRPQFAGGPGGNFEEFGSKWTAPGKTPVESLNDRRNALWSIAPPRVDLNNSEPLNTAAEVLGPLFGGLFSFQNEPAAEHSINNYFALRYFSAKTIGDEREAHAALEMLRKENPKFNPSAAEVFRQLNFVDAVHDLQNARDPEARKEALKRLALMEDSSPGAKARLDKLPEAQEIRAAVQEHKLQEAVQSGNQRGQQQALTRLAELEGKSPSAKEALDRFAKGDSGRELQLKYARAAASGGDQAVKNLGGSQFDRLLDPDGGDAADMARQLEIAKNSLKGDFDPALEKAQEWMSALQVRRNLNADLEDPKKAEKDLTDLMKLSSEKGNTEAKAIFEGIGCKRRKIQNCAA